MFRKISACSTERSSGVNDRLMPLLSCRFDEAQCGQRVDEHRCTIGSTGAHGQFDDVARGDPAIIGEHRATDHSDALSIEMPDIASRRDDRPSAFVANGQRFIEPTLKRCAASPRNVEG